MVELIPVDIGKHARLLFDWRRQPDVARFMYSHKPIEWDSHLAWWHANATNAKRWDRIITWKSLPAGLANLTEIDRENLRADFGMYVADERARLMGAGAAAEFLTLDEAFDTEGLEKISCEVFACNPAAQRLHKQFGFVQEGILRRHARFEGTWVDVHRFSILKSEWAAARPKLKNSLARLLNHPNPEAIP